MAISYDLDLATPLPAAQVAGDLVDAACGIGLFTAAVTSEQLLEEGAVTGLGTWIQAYEPSLEPWYPVITDLGFTPTVSVGFRLDKFTDMCEQDDDMIRLVSRLLHRVPGDAVLHFQLEQIWLLRRDGELSVSEREDIWPPQRLAALTQPYRRVTHTFSGE